MVQELMTQEFQYCIANGHLCVPVYGAWWYVSKIGSKRIWLDKAPDTVQLQIGLTNVPPKYHRSAAWNGHQVDFYFDPRYFGVTSFGQTFESSPDGYKSTPFSAVFAMSEVIDKIKEYIYDAMIMENDTAIKGRIVFKLPVYGELRVW